MIILSFQNLLWINTKVLKEQKYLLEALWGKLFLKRLMTTPVCVTEYFNTHVSITCHPHLKSEQEYSKEQPCNVYHDNIICQLQITSPSVAVVTPLKTSHCCSCISKDGSSWSSHANGIVQLSFPPSIKKPLMLFKYLTLTGMVPGTLSVTEQTHDF